MTVALWMLALALPEIALHELTHFLVAKAFGMHNYRLTFFKPWWHPIGMEFDGEPTITQLRVIYLAPKLIWVVPMAFSSYHPAIRGFALAALADALFSLADWKAGIQGGEDPGKWGP